MSVFNQGFDESSIRESAMFDLDLSQSAEDALFEQSLIQECLSFTDEERDAFLESDLCQELIQEGKMRKHTIVMLSKKDDMNRRTSAIAIQAAKDANDPLYTKLKKIHTLEKAVLVKIMKKYGHKAQKAAKVQQKDWIRNRMPANFGKFGGADRISPEDAAKPSRFEKRYGITSTVK